MTKRQAAVRLRILAATIRNSLWDDDGAEAWATEAEAVADGLDPSGTARAEEASA